MVCLDSTDVTPNTYQLLQKIFEYLFKGEVSTRDILIPFNKPLTIPTDASNFVHAENYERVIESFGSLLYLLDNEILHNYFYAGLFQKDIVSSQACADVLMLCFRLVIVLPLCMPYLMLILQPERSEQGLGQQGHRAGCQFLE